MKKCLLILALLYSGMVGAVDTYYIDVKHSFINFTVRHVVSKTSGTFHDVTGDIKIDPDHIEQATINVKINLDSVNTSHAKRDQNIKAPKYLDVVNFGYATFQSQSITTSDEWSGMITGKLTLHGVTKTITMPFKVLGFGADPWGGQRAGFEASTTIKASDYGFVWMQAVNPPVGDSIKLHLLIEGIKAKTKIEVLEK